MRVRPKAALAAILLAVLAGCGSSEPPVPPPPPPVKDTAFGDMVGTMDRVRGVEDTVQKQKEAADQAIENAEGASSAP